MTQNQGKYWCFTWNNYTDADEATLQNEETHTYLFYGREIAPETGTKHLQGYIEFRTNKRLTALKKAFGDTPHWEKAKGTAAHNKTYCSKGGDTFEDGDASNGGKGKRNDITLLRNQVNEGKPMAEVLSSCQNYQQIRTVEKLYEYKPLSTEYKKRQVYWFHGPTGTGKTKAAYDIVRQENKDFWRSTLNGGQWFNGYLGQPIAILDEVRAKKWSYSDMLELLDGYEIRIPNKGGFTLWNPEIVIVTSPKSPEECYEGQLNFGDGHIDQLLRRITEIRHFEVAPEDVPIEVEHRVPQIGAGGVIVDYVVPGKYIPGMYNDSN